MRLNNAGELKEMMKNNPELKVARLSKNSSPPLAKYPLAKYRAKRTEYGGKWYPSKKQAENAAKFMALVGEGKPYKAYLEEIPFRLPGGSVHRVDHLLLTWDDKAEWYETKGRDLEVGRLKRNMVSAIYHITISLI